MAIPTFHSQPLSSALPSFPFVVELRPRAKSSPSISIISAWMHARVLLTTPAMSGFWKKPKKRLPYHNVFALLLFSMRVQARIHRIMVNVMSLNSRPLFYGRQGVNIMLYIYTINTMSHIANEKNRRKFCNCSKGTFMKRWLNPNDN